MPFGLVRFQCEHFAHFEDLSKVSPYIRLPRAERVLTDHHRSMDSQLSGSTHFPNNPAPIVADFVAASRSTRLQHELSGALIDWPFICVSSTALKGKSGGVFAPPRNPHCELRHDELDFVTISMMSLNCYDLIATRLAESVCMMTTTFLSFGVDADLLVTLSQPRSLQIRWANLSTASARLMSSGTYPWGSARQQCSFPRDSIQSKPAG